MNAKPKAIPSVFHDWTSISDTEQMPMPYDQNRAQKRLQSKEAISPTESESNSPMDENFVNDDIIEENSHVIPPARKPAILRGRKRNAAR